MHGLSPHPSDGLVGVEGVGAHHAEVLAESVLPETVEQRHDQRVYPADAQGTVQALLLVFLRGFQAGEPFGAGLLVASTVVRWPGSQACGGPGWFWPQQARCAPGISIRAPTLAPRASTFPAHLGGFFGGFGRCVEHGYGVDFTGG